MSKMVQTDHTITLAPVQALHPDLAQVEAGVPLAAIADFVSAAGLSLKDIYDIVIPARTLKHRRARHETLSRDESDKFARLVRVFNHANAVFAERDSTASWMKSPRQRFQGRSPMHMLRTELGARMVDEFVGQIDEGMFAT